MSANIRNIHQDCSLPLSWKDARVWGRDGDVRRCEHNKIMLAYSRAGVVPCYWRTVSPMEFATYWRAQRALKAAQAADGKSARWWRRG